MREGVVTNQASKEYLVAPASKLSRVPTSMTVEEAGVFGLNMQTAYSIVRRAAPKPGDHVLVMSATSNTSLAALHALRNSGARVYAATTTTDRDKELEALGARVIHTPRTQIKPTVDRVARAEPTFRARSVFAQWG